jgi:hypothetical protein
MNATEQQLAAALRERLCIIADETSRQSPEQHMRKLSDVSARIESLAAALTPGTNRQLAHFLERRSYDKALALLDGGAPAAP